MHFEQHGRRPCGAWRGLASTAGPPRRVARAIGYSALAIAGAAYLVASDVRIAQRVQTAMPWLPVANIVSSIRRIRHYSAPEYDGRYAPNMASAKSYTATVQLPALPSSTVPSDYASAAAALQELHRLVSPGRAKDLLFNVEARLRDFAEQTARQEAESEAAISRRVHEREALLESEAQKRFSALQAEQETLALQRAQEMRNELGAIEEQYAEAMEKFTREQKALYQQQIDTATEQLEQQVAAAVSHQLDIERDGRLANLQQLHNKVQRLENVVAVVEDKLVEQKKLQRRRAAITLLLKSVVAEKGHIGDMRREWNAIAQSSNDALSRAALDMVSKDTLEIGVQSQPQLYERFTMRVCPALKRLISLEGCRFVRQNTIDALLRVAGIEPKITPQIGFLEYPLASFFSAVLWRIGGHQTQLERAICTAELHVAQGDLDAAARELNQLTGAARLVVERWLLDVREHLMVHTALEILDAGTQ